MWYQRVTFVTWCSDPVLFEPTSIHVIVFLYSIYRRNHPCGDGLYPARRLEIYIIRQIRISSSRALDSLLLGWYYSLYMSRSIPYCTLNVLISCDFEIRCIDSPTFWICRSESRVTLPHWHLDDGGFTRSSIISTNILNIKVETTIIKIHSDPKVCHWQNIRLLTLKKRLVCVYCNYFIIQMNISSIFCFLFFAGRQKNKIIKKFPQDQVPSPDSWEGDFLTDARVKGFLARISSPL